MIVSAWSESEYQVVAAGERKGSFVTIARLVGCV